MEKAIKYICIDGLYNIYTCKIKYFAKWNKNYIIIRKKSDIVMNKVLYIVILIYSLVYASDNVWSKETQAIPQSQYENIIKNYNSNTDSKLDFEDDREEITYRYGYNKTILTVGLSVGATKYDVSNKKDRIQDKDSYTASNIKFTLGKDFTFLHKEGTQPTRIFFTYAFEKLDNNLDFIIWTLGVRENMQYWSFYKNENSKIYPTVSIEVGKGRLEKVNYDISGITSEANIGLTYAYGNNFEYFFNLSYDYAGLLDKKYNDNIDRLSGFGCNLGITYKILYDN